ncbi:MAG: cytochrome c oxidase subunit 3 [Planctomycetota bacterium]
MEIPYTVKVRPDTGLYNGKMGIWLFLASEVMLFGALFSTYIFLRVSNPGPWPPAGTPDLSVLLALFNTFVLITSSVTMVMAWASLKAKNPVDARRNILFTVILALVFMVIKSIEYYGKFSHDVGPSTNVFLGLYFTMTGLHGIHVLGGVVVLGYFAGPGMKMWETEPERFTNRIEITGLYWHFVDLVWIFLFPAIYLLNFTG